MRKNSAQVLRFGIVGTLNTAIDFGLLFVMKSLGLPSVPANTISSTTAFLFSFFANRNYTFRSTGLDIKREMLMFTLVTLFGLWIIQSLVIALVEPLVLSFGVQNELALLIAKLVATVASLIWNYVLYSRVVFKQT